MLRLLGLVLKHYVREIDESLFVISCYVIDVYIKLFKIDYMILPAMGANLNKGVYISKLFDVLLCLSF